MNSQQMAIYGDICGIKADLQLSAVVRTDAGLDVSGDLRHIRAKIPISRKLQNKIRGKWKV